MLRRNAICSFIGLVLISGAARADVVAYQFHVDTSGIATLAPLGGWLDFQFNQANAFGSLPAVATLSVSQSTGYTFGAEWESPGVTGTFPGPIAIPNDQGAANEYSLEVTSWGSSFDFGVSLDGPAAGTPAPYGSAFFVYLLYPDLSQIVSPLPTTGEILNVTIDTAGATTPNGSTFSGGSAAAVPEPGSVWLLLAGIGAAGWKLRR
ncbi:MAG TPA: NF038129 family PEP-CTERM protein [Candidatus Sulfopaludibacter sp.]|nr:NF038129 family PEP-CTERM protein [Candidatus Sulfopaludibacter sp.]